MARPTNRGTEAHVQDFGFRGETDKSNCRDYGSRVDLEKLFSWRDPDEKRGITVANLKAHEQNFAFRGETDKSKCRNYSRWVNLRWGFSWQDPHAKRQRRRCEVWLFVARLTNKNIGTTVVGSIYGRTTVA